MERNRIAGDRETAIAAFVALGAGLLGGTGVILWLREGIPFLEPDLAERARYLVRHQKCWTGGWLLAGLAALALVNLYLGLASRWRSRAPHLCRLAVASAAAGLAVDLTGMTIWIFSVPGLPAASLEPMEKAAEGLVFFLAKALYTLAGILLTVAGAGELPKRLVVLSVPVWFSGAWLSAATLLRCPSAQTGSLVSLAGFFLLWAFLIGSWALKQVGSPDSAPAPYTPDPRD